MCNYIESIAYIYLEGIIVRTLKFWSIKAKVEISRRKSMS